MASLAMLLKKGPNLPVIANFLQGFFFLGRLVAPKSGAASQKSRARSKRHPDGKRRPQQTKNGDKLALNQRHRCNHRFRKARLSAIQSGFLRQVPERFKSILAEAGARFKE